MLSLNPSNPTTITIEPIVSYPTEAETGGCYLLTIDLRAKLQNDNWPFEAEEIVINCLLDSNPVFRNEPVGDPSIVLHRFGGSYGPASFLLFAPDRETNGRMRITLVNDWGIPLHQFELQEVHVGRSTEYQDSFSATLIPRNVHVGPPDKIATKGVPADHTDSDDLFYSNDPSAEVLDPSEGTKDPASSSLPDLATAGVPLLDTTQQSSYEMVPPLPISEDRLKHAGQLLDSLPLSFVPELSNALPHGSRMPLSRNPLFVGRKDDLKKLAEAMKGGDGNTSGPLAAITGMGGMGKTQLAVEFVFRYGRYFEGGVHWLSFAEPAGVPAEVAACIGAVDPDMPPNYWALSLDDQVSYVLAAWQSPLPRLLVFDSCEDEELLARWRPLVGGCRILLTSRKAKWSRTLGVRGLALGVFSRVESIALLRKFTPNLAANEGSLDEIAAELGDLPLALHLAGHFLHRYLDLVTPARYLADLRSPRLLEHPSLSGRTVDFSPTMHETSIARTFALSLARLDTSSTKDRIALRLLARAARFAPGESILAELLIQTLDLSGQAITHVTADDPSLRSHHNIQKLDALKSLLDLGLLEEESAGSVRLHRLLAIFTLNMELDKQAEMDVERVLLGQARSLNRQGNLAAMLRFQPHLRFVTENAGHREDSLAAQLCSELGHFLNMLADYTSARFYYERALAIQEKVLGPDHPDTATSLNNLAAVLVAQGDYAGAKSLAERAFYVYEKMLGPDHPRTATSLNNLARVLQAQGDHAGAMSLAERALAIQEKTLGPNHPYIATSMNNLASLLEAQGDYEGARTLCERALAIQEKALGPDHPDTAMSLNNLAEVDRALGDYQEARALHERALAIREMMLGPDHPDTATSLNNLAAVLVAQGDYVAAMSLAKRALAILEKVLGPDYPTTATGLSNLANVYRALGDYQEARALHERALAIREMMLGPGHPDTATSLNNLGMLLADMGNYQEAVRWLERAATILKSNLGTDHANTQTVIRNVAAVRELTHRLENREE